MRARKKKHASERLSNCAEYLENDPRAYRGAWRDWFHTTGRMEKKAQTLALEIGCGKGDFATGYALAHPETAFVALERIRDVLVLAAEKAKAKETRNLVYLCEDAQNLKEFFAPGEVDLLFLNFSDPWPKARHAKRRLTSPLFLLIYKEILAPDGVLCFKTDNRDLFDYSLETLPAAGFVLSRVTRDLHHSPDNEGNIQTEYERNFSAKGFPIHRVEARPR